MGRCQCKALVYVVQVYLYTMTNYSTHFTGADNRISNKEGWGGWYIVMERAFVDRYHANGVGGGGGGRWDTGRGCATLFLILDPSQNGSSASTSHQSTHKSIILYLSTGI